jgi:hypothetical protein
MIVVDGSEDISGTGGLSGQVGLYIGGADTGCRQLLPIAEKIRYAKSSSGRASRYDLGPLLLIACDVEYVR